MKPTGSVCLTRRMVGDLSQKVRLNATDPDRIRPGPKRKMQASLFVVFRRLFVRFENFGVVGENYVAALSFDRSLHIVISIKHSRRVLDETDAGKNILIEVLLRVA